MTEQFAARREMLLCVTRGARVTRGAGERWGRCGDARVTTAGRPASSLGTGPSGAADPAGVGQHAGDGRGRLLGGAGLLGLRLGGVVGYPDRRAACRPCTQRARGRPRGETPRIGDPPRSGLRDRSRPRSSVAVVGVHEGLRRGAGGARPTAARTTTQANTASDTMKKLGGRSTIAESTRPPHTEPSARATAMQRHPGRTGGDPQRGRRRRHDEREQQQGADDLDRHRDGEGQQDDEREAQRPHRHARGPRRRRGRPTRTSAAGPGRRGCRRPRR